MKPILYFASSLFCLSICSAWADAPEEETSAMPPLPPSVAYQPEAVTKEPRGLITPTVAPRVDRGQDILVDADFIWWKTYESDFDYAQIDGNTLSPKTQFEPGFKVGTGMDLYHDGWDLYVQYTWLRQGEVSNGGSSAEPGYSTFIVPYSQKYGVLSTILILDASAWKRYQFNILDVETGRDFFISKRLTLRPHVGIKGASLFEKTKIIYNGTDDIPVETATITLKQNLSGIGIRGGLDTVWYIIPSLGFYGDFAFTALWGNFHNRLISKVILNNELLNYPVKSNSQDIIPVFEAGFGLTYRVWFKKERYELYTKAGWEEQVWVGYNKNLVNGQSNSNGSLTMQGLTWKIGFVF